ncbi:hypothetical protein VTN00DRAFT_3753 [Thermoascus crustaceus]|uniref:uncharacterized protein n=1 Tax=Thermoascus crustaceus TaxID=5088 RepID=UPI003744A856
MASKGSSTYALTGQSSTTASAWAPSESSETTDGHRAARILGKLPDQYLPGAGKEGRLSAQGRWSARRRRGSKCWRDDNTPPSRWMFPDGTPPATSISLNARYDPIFHVKVRQALRELRTGGILIIGSGSIVHNLFRANWIPFLLTGAWNTLQPGYKPEKWALEFERAVRDTILSNSGPRLAGALVRLTDHPSYKIARWSNDHFYPLLVIAGVVSYEEDEGVYDRKMAETWDMGNVCSSQYL